MAERAAKYPPEEAEKITGVPAADIRRIAVEFATARGVAEDGWYAAKNGNELDLYMYTVPLLVVYTMYTKCTFVIEWFK